MTVCQAQEPSKSLGVAPLRRKVCTTGHSDPVTNRASLTSLNKTTRERIERALEYMAMCVMEQGEVYLPIFERLEDELAKAQAKDSALERARKLAGYKRK